VNTMLSLFTPSDAFAMQQDAIFDKYVKEMKEGRLSDNSEDQAVGSWDWMTSSEALAKVKRPAPLMHMLTKKMANELDRILIETISGNVEKVMVPKSGWEKIYDKYRSLVKELVQKTYTRVISEDVQERKVHHGILRRIEWMTMDHGNRLEQPYPLLTKSVLPLAADTLQRVEKAIKEVSIYLKSMYMSAQA
jgi:hypothetical protein